MLSHPPHSHSSRALYLMSPRPCPPFTPQVLAAWMLPSLPDATAITRRPGPERLMAGVPGRGGGGRADSVLHVPDAARRDEGSAGPGLKGRAGGNCVWDEGVPGWDAGVQKTEKLSPLRGNQERLHRGGEASHDQAQAGSTDFLRSGWKVRAGGGGTWQWESLRPARAVVGKPEEPQRRLRPGS